MWYSVYRPNMYLKLFLLLLVNRFSSTSQSETLENIRSLFEYEKCIEGTLTSILDKEVEVDSALIKSLLDSKKEYEKGVLSSIHELSTYNEITYDYELIEEQGHPHNKEFTVSLTLGDEKYDGHGASIKKAQRDAATIALENTDYEHPPVKLKEEVPKTPTVILNNIGTKLAISVQYFLVKDLHEQVIEQIEDRPFKSYADKLNDSVYDPHYKSNVPNEDATVYGPFTVRCQVGESSFIGSGHTIQAARHDAALNAIKGLKKEALEANSPCMKEGSEKECKQARNSLKSSVSQIYEAGQQRKIDVSFDVVDEAGPAHKRVFTIRCKIGHLTTEAEGHSKKEAKKKAAEMMLGRLSELPELSDEAQILSNMKSGKKNKSKKKKIKKRDVEKLGSMLDEVYDTLFPSEPVEKKQNVRKPVDSKDKSKNDEDNAPRKQSSQKSKNSDDRKKSAIDELLDLSQHLKMEVQVSDFQVQSKFYSFISLGMKPPFVCFGEEITKPKSKEKAAYAALLFLHHKGFGFSFKEKETATDECNSMEEDNLYISPYSKESLE